MQTTIAGQEETINYKDMITVNDIMRVRVKPDKNRFLLFRTDQKKEELIGSYVLIRQAREIAIDCGYESYTIYDTLEDRTIIEYNENK